MKSIFIFKFKSYYALNTCVDSFKRKNSSITGQKQLLNNINIEEVNKKMKSKVTDKKSFENKLRNSLPSLTKYKK